MKTNNISKNLKYLRKQKGLTQLQLRTSLGYTRSTWSNYENGLTNPSIDDLIIISTYFGISLDELIAHDLEAKEESFTIETNETKPPRTPVIYAANDFVTMAAEPEIAYLLTEIKKLQEDVNMIKEGKTKS